MLSHLVVLGHELVKALLDDVVPVQVLDESDHMQAERDDDGVNLGLLQLKYSR